ncbi:MAG: 4-aminobutyrate--2-oxoglutarate transaminase [Candidatus Eremiobacteraeota bacterium]|nr:4-aminobutyrate--2-oxoglutarate transaminase [Candidatus Eremiobacteraeota bacterium]
MSETTEALRARRAASVPRGVGQAHPLFIDRGHGAIVHDVEGREYIDFVGGIGVLNVGHTHPAVANAIAEQAQRLTHFCFQVAMYEPYVAVAEALNRLAPGPTPKKTLLLSTGAEATENAVKIAREYTRRQAVVAFHQGYHGRTLLALTMTGKNAPYKQHFGPFCTEVYHAPYPSERHGWSTERALDALDTLFAAEVSPDNVAAIIIEPVLGEGGFLPAPFAFLQALRKLADRHGIVLICDEIQTGFARTGAMFAIEHAGIEADLLTVAKSIAGGLPLAAVIGKAEIMDAPGPGGLGGTFAGNPVACAAALAALRVIEEENLPARAKELGAKIRTAFATEFKRWPQIADVRGLGAMIGIEFVRAPDGSSYAERIVDEARKRGLLLLLAGNGDVVRVLVPLVAPNAVIDEALSIFAECCSAVFSHEVKQNS